MIKKLYLLFTVNRSDIKYSDIDNNIHQLNINNNTKQLDIDNNIQQLVIDRNIQQLEIEDLSIKRLILIKCSHYKRKKQC